MLPKKKPPAKDALAALLEEDTGESVDDSDPDADMDDDFEDEATDPMMGGEDSLEGEDDMMSSGIDPEEAALCERLGFSEPEQQQALLDLIDMVTARKSAPPLEDESLSAPPGAVGAGMGPY